MFSNEPRCRWHQRRHNFLAAFDNDKVRSHHNVTCLHEERVVDLIIAGLCHPTSALTLMQMMVVVVVFTAKMMVALSLTHWANPSIGWKLGSSELLSLSLLSCHSVPPLTERPFHHSASMSMQMPSDIAPHLCCNRCRCRVALSPLGNCISINVDADVERRRAGGDKIGDALLVEASGVAVRADLIVIGGGQAIVSASMPATPSPSVYKSRAEKGVPAIGSDSRVQDGSSQRSESMKKQSDDEQTTKGKKISLYLNLR
ncbi:hypothetical protein B296_00038897 [Ensete ventricosum]|uniref:Uncharacterized protein n=1 Tax=Ensete ventricosum TaxID=4639 RepID=A0A426ZBI6_ENSVE|nr:hypothetical protein B296_00038897 [Ensete ventricosum]